MGRTCWDISCVAPCIYLVTNLNALLTPAFNVILSQDKDVMYVTDIDNVIDIYQIYKMYACTLYCVQLYTYEYLHITQTQTLRYYNSLTLRTYVDIVHEMHDDKLYEQTEIIIMLLAERRILPTDKCKKDTGTQTSLGRDDLHITPKKERHFDDFVTS